MIIKDRKGEDANRKQDYIYLAPILCVKNFKIRMKNKMKFDSIQVEQAFVLEGT